MGKTTKEKTSTSSTTVTKDRKPTAGAGGLGPKIKK